MAKNNDINRETQDLIVAPGAAGDSYIQYAINGTSKFIVGVSEVIATSTFTISLNIEADMDLGDTAYTRMRVDGLASNTVDAPATPTDTWFCGFLIC